MRKKIFVTRILLGTAMMLTMMFLSGLFALSSVNALVTGNASGLFTVVPIMTTIIGIAGVILAIRTLVRGVRDEYVHFKHGPIFVFGEPVGLTY